MAANDLAAELERLALAVQFLPSGREFVEERLRIAARLRDLAARAEVKPRRKWFKADRA